MDPRISSFVKKHLPILIATLSFLLLTLLLKQIQFKQRRVTLSHNYKEIYKNSPTVEIASFDEGEPWQGNFTLDSLRTFDGANGINLSSNQGKQNTIFLAKTIDLSPYDYIYTYIYVDKAVDLMNIASFSLEFTGKDKTTTSLKMSNLHEGWNLLTLPKNKFNNTSFNWKGVEKVALSLTAQKNSTAQVALDRLWAQNKLINTEALLAYPPEYLNIKSVGKNTYLHLGTPIKSSVDFKKVVKNDFGFTVGLAPIKLGLFGLSFQTDQTKDNGYYLEIDGQKMEQWSLYKKMGGKVALIKKGTLTDNLFEKDAYAWLRVEKKGDKIDFSYSINNQLFIPVSQITDNTFTKGNIGIFAQGAYLIDSIEVKE